MVKRLYLIILIAALFLVGCQHMEALSKEISDIKPLPQEDFKPVEIVPYTADYDQIVPVPKIRPAPRQEVKTKIESPFKLDTNVSWYGPGFYGKRTACGHAYTKELLGVAHKTLPCGTKVTFRYGTKQFTVPVIDRGPYVDGRQWDLSGGLCVALEHCFTGEIYYRIEK